MHPSLLQIEESDASHRWSGSPSWRRKANPSARDTWWSTSPSQSRSLLSRCTSSRVPFAWTINPVSRLRVRLQVLLCALHARVHGDARWGGLRAQDLCEAAGGVAAAAGPEEGEARARRSPSARQPIPTSRRRSASRSRAESWRNWRCTMGWRSGLSPSRTSSCAMSTCCGRSASTTRCS